MKKVLVICYYFPPCNGAPSWRPYSWAQNFHLHGIRPVIVARHWKGNENTWEDFIKENNDPPKFESFPHYDIWSLPSMTMPFNKFIEKHKYLGKIIGDLYFFFLTLFGRFNTEVDVYYAFKEHIRDHLKANAYDAVVISSPPSNVLKLIKMVKENSSAPIVIDFRDLWNNLMLTVSYSPSFKQKVWDTLYKLYYRKWLKNVDLITVINQPFREVISKLTAVPVMLVSNGYEAGIFKQLKRSQLNKFTFTVVGNIYPEQEINIMLEGLQLFLLDKSSEKVVVKFIGAAALPVVAGVIRDAIPENFLQISGRVPKQLALQATLDAHVLSFCGWRGVRGMVSTKAFDYIASGNYVLIAPGDGDALDALINECNCGTSVNTSEDFCKQLNKLYLAWESNAFENVLGDNTKIEFYSRENQAKIMADLLVNLIKKK